MCGILGIAAVRGRAVCPDRETIERMRDVMRHRGPDGRGCTGYASQAEQLQGRACSMMCAGQVPVQAFDETAVFFIAAAVFHQAGQPRNQPLG